MWRSLFYVLFIASTLPAALAAKTLSPYIGQESRDIKALSPEAIQDLLDGKGMGFAKAAELNGYPGPAHVLELEDDLALTTEQHDKTKTLFDSMLSKAKSLGQQLLDQEHSLEQLYATKQITTGNLKRVTETISRLKGELRYTHLAAHLTQWEILSPEQRDLYFTLRGYQSHVNSVHSHHKHDSLKGESTHH